MTDPRPTREHDKFIVRLPDGMRDRLSTEAKVRGVSMNALIVEIIENALDSGEEYALAVLRAELRDVSRRVVEHTRNAAESSEYAAQLHDEIRKMEERLRNRGIDPDEVMRARAARKLATDAPR